MILQHDLPLEVIGETLQHDLPLKSLMSFKCVNKESYAIVDSLFFFFPIKVICDILIRLPVKSLLRFNCVNKK